MSCFNLIVMVILFMGVVYGQTEVETTHGPVVGTEDTYSGETVRRFRGIPFAKPPIGTRRFLPPEEPDKWTQPLDTKEYSPMCHQFIFLPDFQGNISSLLNEDCLYLNVFAPKGGSNLPVMVWIHGGGLATGTASDYHPEALAVSGNVVVVTINYRLDIFGFFSSGNDLVEGNSALLDQIMALKWIKMNIKNFGGDPDRVTLFGQSAGGYCVNLHMVSPMSKGLFHRAITQSGAQYGYNVPKKSSYYAKTKLLAGFLNCPDTEDSQKMLECLQEVPPNMLLGAAYAPQVSYHSGGVPIVVGDRFLPKDPTELWNNGEINDADYMIGFNSEEGIIGFSAINNTVFRSYLYSGISAESTDFVTLAKMALVPIEVNADLSNNNPVWEFFNSQYFPDYTDLIMNMRGMLNLIGDTYFNGPIMNCAQAMARTSTNKVYFYYFDQVLNISQDLPPGHIAGLLKHSGSDDMNIRAGHGDEISYIFGYISENFPDMPSNIYDISSEADRAIGKSVMNAWVSFAATGIPKVLMNDGTELALPQYDLMTQQYLEIKHPMSDGSVKRRLLPGRMGIHTDVLPKYLSRKNDDVPETVKETECEDTPSLIDRNKAETALFILVAVAIVLLLVTVILIMNYCSMKTELEKRTV